MPTITASTNGGYVLANNQSSHANARNAASGNVIVTQASRVSTSLSYVRAAGRGGSGQDFTGGRYDGAPDAATYSAEPTAYSGSS